MDHAPNTSKMRLPGIKPQGSKGSGQRQNEFEQAMNEESEKLADENGYDIVLRDTSFGGTRGWEESLLYVPNDPLLIRPFEDTGVVVDVLDSGVTQVSLNNPVQDSKYVVRAFSINTGHTLCLVCRDTFNYYFEYRAAKEAWSDDSGNNGRFPMSNNIVHHTNLWSLHAFAEVDKCFLCTELHRKVDLAYPDLPPAKWHQYKIECCWPKKLNHEREQKVWFVMLDSSVKKQSVWNYQHMLRISLWPKAFFATHFDTAKIIKSDGEDLFADSNRSDTTSTSTTEALAATWLKKCNKNADGNHNACSQHDPNYLPTRLLDVRHALQTNRLRLCLSSSIQLSARNGNIYATLSHCWGKWGAGNNPVLREGNVNSRLHQGIECSELPKTFQDAIKVASWVGIDWLWIDCLCIIQDSKSDWVKEASEMDKVYQNAEVNISADFGEDSRTGCFTTRDPVQVTPIELHCTSSGSTWSITMDSTFHWMTSAPSLSRAWISRERQLARRILHFTEKELVWECCGQEGTSFASEMMPGNAPFKKVFNKDSTKLQLGSHQLLATTDEHEDELVKRDRIYTLWNSMCEGISTKSVTYLTDFPVILSSLAKEFHRSVPEDRYIGGHWESIFVESLSWYRISGTRPPPDQTIAPSWSWLSTATNLKLALCNRHQNKLSVTKVEKIDTELKYEDPYGPLSKGILHMEGYVRPIQIVFLPEQGVQLSVFDGPNNGVLKDRMRIIGRDWDPYEGDTFHFALDDFEQKLDGVTLNCFAFFTTINEWAQDLDTCGRELSCILLQEVAGQEMTFSRIGVLDHLCDAYSFQLRYNVVHEQEELEDTKTTEQAFIEQDIEVQDSPGSSPTGVHSATVGDAPVVEPRRVAASSEQSTGKQNEKFLKSRASNISEDGSVDDDNEEIREEVWNLFARYIRRTRWTIISAARRTEREAREKSNAIEGKEANNEIGEPENTDTDAEIAQKNSKRDDFEAETVPDCKAEHDKASHLSVNPDNHKIEDKLSALPAGGTVIPKRSPSKSTSDHELEPVALQEDTHDGAAIQSELSISTTSDSPPEASSFLSPTTTEPTPQSKIQPTIGTISNPKPSLNTDHDHEHDHDPQTYPDHNHNSDSNPADDKDDDNDNTSTSSSSSTSPNPTYIHLRRSFRRNKSNRGPLAAVISRVRSLAHLTEADSEDEDDDVFHTLCIFSETAAYGEQKGPEETLYQFDDAFEAWRGAVSEELETEEDWDGEVDGEDEVDEVVSDGDVEDKGELETGGEEEDDEDENEKENETKTDEGSTSSKTDTNLQRSRRKKRGLFPQIRRLETRKIRIL